jgi:hypothetical protein
MEPMYAIIPFWEMLKCAHFTFGYFIVFQVKSESCIKYCCTVPRIIDTIKLIAFIKQLFQGQWRLTLCSVKNETIVLRFSHGLYWCSFTIQLVTGYCECHLWRWRYQSHIICWFECCKSSNNCLFFHFVDFICIHLFDVLICIKLKAGMHIYSRAAAKGKRVQVGAVCFSSS